MQRLPDERQRKDHVPGSMKIKLERSSKSATSHQSTFIKIISQIQQTYQKSAISSQWKKKEKGKKNTENKATLVLFQNSQFW